MVVRTRPGEAGFDGSLIMPGGFANGTKVILNAFLTHMVPYPRSPGRAKRRAKMGHRQHYITRPQETAYKLRDGTLVMHPAMWAKFKELPKR